MTKSRNEEQTKQQVKVSIHLDETSDQAVANEIFRAAIDAIYAWKRSKDARLTGNNGYSTRKGKPRRETDKLIDQAFGALEKRTKEFMEAGFPNTYRSYARKVLDLTVNGGNCFLRKENGSDGTNSANALTEEAIKSMNGMFDATHIFLFGAAPADSSRRFFKEAKDEIKAGAKISRSLLMHRLSTIGAHLNAKSLHEVEARLRYGWKCLYCANLKIACVKGKDK